MRYPSHQNVSVFAVSKMPIQLTKPIGRTNKGRAFPYLDKEINTAHFSYEYVSDKRLNLR